MVEKYYKSRIYKLKKELENKNFSSGNLIILKDENIFYLTGFYAKDSESILLLIDNDLYLLVNFIYLEQAKKTVRLNDLKVIQYNKNKYKKLAEILIDYNEKIIGVDGQNINHEGFKKLEKYFSNQNKKLISVIDTVENLRAVKDDIELYKIEKACSIVDRVFSYIINFKSLVLNDFTEIELANEIKSKMISFDAEGSSFDPVVANNEYSSLPHYLPSRKKIGNGIILLDFGARFDNYCSDITRTILNGEYKNYSRFKKIYDIVLGAQNISLDNCREGITCADLDSKARNFIKSKGYGRNFGHGLGHGVGIEVHEKPRIGVSEKTILKENMVITIEPGIYIENFGGVRIEDLVIVKKNGIKNLYKSSKILIELE